MNLVPNAYQMTALNYFLSSFCNSPLAINRATSSAPPTSTPLTNTIGKVGQPDHIFNALRRRQVLK